MPVAIPAGEIDVVMKTVHREDVLPFSYFRYLCTNMFPNSPSGSLAGSGFTFLDGGPSVAL